MKSKLVKTIVSLFLSLILSATPVAAKTDLDILFSDGMPTTENVGTSGTENAQPYTLPRLDGRYYPLTGKVTGLTLDIAPETDLVEITQVNGNVWEFYAPSTDCWELGDLASCIMDGKGTETVYDDDIVIALYCGTPKQFMAV